MSSRHGQLPARERAGFPIAAVPDQPTPDDAALTGSALHPTVPTREMAGKTALDKMTHGKTTPDDETPDGMAARRVRPGRPLPETLAAARMELRQLRYFVTLSEELHFGRAAAREHIAPSALSQQLQRLERALGVLLVDRDNRQVALTPAGARFLLEVREILDHVDRAVCVAQGLATAAPTLRVGVLDEAYDAIRPVLRAVQTEHPELEIHQVQAGVPEQCRMLADGRLDLGVGRACAGAPTIASELFRLDPLGVMVSGAHPIARLSGVPVAALRHETLLLADEERAPEFHEFVAEVCHSAGFFPALHPGSVPTLRAAVDVVDEGRCVLVAPESAAAAVPGLTWRPLVPAVPRYPWSLLWRAQNPSRTVRTVVATARRLATEHGWREDLTERAS